MDDREQQGKIFRVFKEKSNITKTPFKDDDAIKTFLDETH